MVSIAPPLPPGSRTPRWILLAGAAIGSLDLAFAFAFWGLGYGVAPTRILHSIAAGVQGADAFQGGAASATLGMACHYFIATCMVAAYVLASRRMPMLLQRPLACGLAYGLALYAFMSWIVVPLSNAPEGGRMPLAWTLSSVAVHALIGVLCAATARRALRRG
jgi:hypothetical protein